MTGLSEYAFDFTKAPYPVRHLDRKRGRGSVMAHSPEHALCMAIHEAQPDLRMPYSHVLRYLWQVIERAGGEPDMSPESALLPYVSFEQEDARLITEAEAGEIYSGKSPRRRAPTDQLTLFRTA